MDVGLPADVTIPIGTIKQIYGLPADYPLELAHGIGRLRDGVTLQRVHSQLQTLWPNMLRATVPSTLTAAERDAFFAQKLEVTSAATGFSYLRDWYATPLWLLVASTGWLLLMTCANLASLLLARGTARQQEMRVRSALGASRWQLVRQLLTESVLLSVTGTALGVPVAWWGAHGLVRMMWNRPDVVPLDLAPDWRATFVIGASAVVTGVAFGIIPAWRTSRDDQNSRFQTGGPTFHSTSRWSEPLLVAQAALAVMLLVGAGLLTRNLQQLRNSRPGFETDGVSLAPLVPQPGGYANLDVAVYCRALSDQLRVLPGVQAVALSIPEPLMGLEAGEEKRPVVASTAAPDNAGLDATVVAISPEYFRTMGVPLTGGRDFTWLDDGHRKPVAIVSAALAGKLFHAREAIGQPIRVGADQRHQQMEIVGVSADARLADLHTMQPLFVFVPLLQGSPESVRSPTIVIRSRDRSAALRTRVRRLVESLGQDYVSRERTLAEQAETSLLRERLLALGATYFGGLAGALMAIGLGGVVSYAVTRRTREIGIRAALGASPSAVRTMILKQTFRVTTLGLGTGLPGTWIAMLIIRGTFPSIDAYDPVTFAGAGFVVAVITLGARGCRLDERPRLSQRTRFVVSSLMRS